MCLAVELLAAHQPMVFRAAMDSFAARSLCADCVHDFRQQSEPWRARQLQPGKVSSRNNIRDGRGYRFNRREDANMFYQTVRRMAGVAPVQYAKLIEQYTYTFS